LFAARAARGALLGVYALSAEWRLLMDPATQIEVARLKLLWWREELDRLTAGVPLHPITRYLAELPRAAAADFAPLTRSVDAAADHLAGAPLERGSDLESHAGALYGGPLLAAARLGGARGDGDRAQPCIAALAAGQYLAGAIGDYGREARSGRIPFAIDELLAAGIGNDDLVAGEPPPRLQGYLLRLRRQAGAYFAAAAAAAAALGPEHRPPLRHLPVLAALGARHLHERRRRAGADFRLGDLYNAWNAARRAALAR
jgi:phytoene synthase